MQCLDEHSGILAYAKIYADDNGRRSYHVYTALRQRLLATGSKLLLPRALAYSETHRTLLLEPLDGRQISDLDCADLPNGFRQFGAALAALHELAPPAHLPRFKRVESGSLIRAAQIVGLARPDVAIRAEKLARELCSRQPSAEPFVWLHGDVHPKNGILRNDSLALIDLDQSAAGTAAADLGSLLAVLHYNRLIGLLSLDVSLELADAFLAGYGTVRALPDSASLWWHTAASLLSERALRTVNRIRQEGLQHLDELLADAEGILTRRKL
jgi:Ser/Thr protein kinase RdoA (MazF antagonist)